MKISKAQIQAFQDIVWDYYRQHGRKLPWREPEPDGSFDPYKILVSELMLQQTQVNRVIPKYRQFMMTFPDVQSLAHASLGEVLRLWAGLGYNRRAKYLHEAARTITARYHGKFPVEQEQLMQLPGIGKNTAGAIVAYSYNRPAVFIETNVRSVIIYHFFTDREKVTDSEIMPLVRMALPPESTREWYWALMDYGTFLKSTVGNPARQSAHYTRQGAFHGSVRQLRGLVLRHLYNGPLSLSELNLAIQDERLFDTLQQLSREGLLLLTDKERYTLP